MFSTHGAGWGWGWWFLMSIGMIAFWALIIYAIVWLVRGRDIDQRDSAPPEPPEKILERRLARGEISLDEYERLRDAIHQPPHAPPTDQQRRPAA